MWYGNEKWDKRFLTLAEHIASWSKDPSTKCGAVIVSGKKIISVGYNGFPAGCKDDNALYQNRDRKYLRVIHAEQNAIYTARENLELLECTIYIHPLPPCAQCAAAIIQVGLGILHGGVSGLISGRVFLYIVANLVLLRDVLNKKKYSLISIPRMKFNFIRYLNFPKYSMVANLANILSRNLINILISLFYSISTLGLYSLVNRVLSMPMVLIGRSYGQVFYQKATEEKHISGSAKVIFNRTYKRLTLVSIIIGLILFFLIKDAFAIIFGEQWRIAGYYCQILLPLFLVRFIVSPISIINSIFEKQKISLYWQIGLLILTLSVFIITKVMDLSFVTFLYCLTWITTLYYILLFFILKRIASGK